MNITKRSAKQSLELATDAALGRYLKVTRQYLWSLGEDDPLPEGQQWKLRALRPDIFPLPESSVQANEA